ncbi:MAG TPA: AI-2E family transporter, partial [Bacteroidales bacterium]|nr:AI-2E family transporter [Bacteroidales bacterium]
MVIITFIIALVYLGRNILIPLVFGGIFSLLLYPVCNFLEKHRIPRIISIIISYILVFLIIAGIIAFFSSQVINLFDDIKDFGKTLTKLLDKLIYF